MREILFRGKRIDNGEWVYGFYTLTPTGHNVEPSIITGTERLCSIPQFIDPTTIGQYTGLKDKNGTKIFEGDILKCYWDGIHADGSAVSSTYTLTDIRMFFEDTCGSVYEVIGNIHDKEGMK